MSNTCKCGASIPEPRIRFGYKTCVNCSSEKAVGAVPVINHKTGNTIEIVKDPVQAAKINAMMKRKGFGIMAGIAGSNKQNFIEPISNNKRLSEPPPPPVDRVIARRMPTYDFDRVGQETMDLFEKSGVDQAHAHIENALLAKRIYGKQAEQLREIIRHMVSQNC
jgi:hypothetical protein